MREIERHNGYLEAYCLRCARAMANGGECGGFGHRHPPEATERALMGCYRPIPVERDQKGAA